jgi:hypothetical protein
MFEVRVENFSMSIRIWQVRSHAKRLDRKLIWDSLGLFLPPMDISHFGHSLASSSFLFSFLNKFMKAQINCFFCFLCFCFFRLCFFVFVFVLVYVCFCVFFCPHQTIHFFLSRKIPRNRCATLDFM